MVIRRKSDPGKQPKQCAYYQVMRHEQTNQIEHEQRQFEVDDHDRTPCWCCCDDCTDLTWYYPARKGIWWGLSPSGELPSMQETCAESPGSPAKASSSTTSSPPPEPH